MIILEISDIGKDNSCNLLIGDFNARSQIWGYGFEDHRGRVLSEFLTLNNFSICNRTDLGPTFNSSTGHGFPDLSLISTAHQHLLDAWWIDNSDSLSDHKLICVQLADGQVSYVNALDFITVEVYQGCPQGSVLAPHIWNFYFNEILYLSNDHGYLQAYADDLVLLVVADSRKKLETEVSSFLDDLSDNLKVLNLEVASEKTLVVVFRGTQNKNKQKKGVATFKRTPIFKIKGRTIRTVDSLKYLGIYIDNQLNWNEHISNLKIKIYNLIQNFHSVSGPNWGAGVSLLKHWYLSVIQPALLFGAAVWGSSFTKQQILSLFSVQKVALIKISKCYRTCPTNALNVFLGLPPLHVVARSLFIKFQIWYDRSNEYDFINVDHLDHFIKINHINLNKRIITFPPLIKNPDFDIYTDGSGIDGNVGATVCIFKNNILSQSFQFKLSNYNSVFQAELAAINFAVGWALEGGFKVNIYTDSYFSIQVLKKSDVKSGFINDIKSNVFRALGSVGLSWVKAQAGIPGNKLADQFAKSALRKEISWISLLPIVF
ncbi:Putative protein in type-1 retrotransposable element R1DM [Araneus ventricosus]|uniref:Retrovirus-related Pol polyprotein from type-1 retrotransposable element R1 n=1 Tax=Araneus ventricosus TaxID=182803 RepID=A0A4Y2WR67_ARAVE|nr:Putative protein in type-1 retrotransposable element R1DM [Araneus ventricosus]